MNRHPFLNLSITPNECSLFCSRALAKQYFAPFLASSSSPTRASKLSSKDTSAANQEPTISKEDFVAISVEGEGLDAGQRVLELTTPLALAGISIFFITTYFSDYILVPTSARCKVVSALEARGFSFSQNYGAVPPSSPPPTSPNQNHNHISHSRSQSHSHSQSHASHTRLPSSTSSLSSLAHSLSSLSPLSPLSHSTTPSSSFATSNNHPSQSPQQALHALLSRHAIRPTLHRSIRLHHCAAAPSHAPRADASGAKLQLGLIQCLAHPPRFLGLTLTEGEPASLLLEKGLRGRFEGGGASGGYDGDGEEGFWEGDEEGDEDGYEEDGGGAGGGGDLGGCLMGSRDVLVPITLDLSALGEGVTGVVCGVAGMLIGGGGEEEDDKEAGAAIEMSYLSTARGATVLVDESVVERAVERLREGEGAVDVV